MDIESPVSDETVEGDEKKGKQSSLRLIREWIVVVVVALGAALFVRVYVLQQFYISGPSMETTLFQNNRVLVNKLSYKLHGIHRGDVVVFDRVTTNGKTIEHDDLIKRVIAIESDSVEIKNCVVFVNGSAIQEPYLDEEVLAFVNPVDRCRVPNMSRQIVPTNQLFVMGDNRPDSFDSRSFGTISEKLVVGRAFAIVWPFSRISLL